MNKRIQKNNKIPNEQSLQLKSNHQNTSLQEITQFSGAFQRSRVALHLSSRSSWFQTRVPCRLDEPAKPIGSRAVFGVVAFSGMCITGFSHSHHSGLGHSSGCLHLPQRCSLVNHLQRLQAVSFRVHFAGPNQLLLHNHVLQGLLLLSPPWNTHQEQTPSANTVFLALLQCLIHTSTSVNLVWLFIPIHMVTHTWVRTCLGSHRAQAL